LVKGENFITPKSIPVKEIIANTEASIMFLPDCKAVKICSEVSRMLRRGNPKKKQHEKQAVKQLNTNKSILILPADEENGSHHGNWRLQRDITQPNGTCHTQKVTERSNIQV